MTLRSNRAIIEQTNRARIAQAQAARRTGTPRGSQERGAATPQEAQPDSKKGVPRGPAEEQKPAQNPGNTAPRQRLKPGPKPRTDAEERHRKAVLAAMKRWNRRHRHEIRDRRAERRFRFRDRAMPEVAARDGFAIISARGNPPLLWIDPHGVLHRETECSAEELIRRWNAKQKGGHPQCPQQTDQPSTK